MNTKQLDALPESARAYLESASQRTTCRTEPVAHWKNKVTRLCEALANALLDEKDIRGDLAVAIAIFHEAGQTRQWHHKWDEDVAELLAKHWPVTKSRRDDER